MLGVPNVYGAELVTWVSIWRWPRDPYSYVVPPGLSRMLRLLLAWIIQVEQIFPILCLPGLWDSHFSFPSPFCLIFFFFTLVRTSPYGVLCRLLRFFFPHLLIGCGWTYLHYFRHTYFLTIELKSGFRGSLAACIHDKLTATKLANRTTRNYIDTKINTETVDGKTDTITGNVLMEWSHCHRQSMRRSE